MADPTSDDDAAASLERHLYWADVPGARRSGGTPEVREEMLEFAARMRTDERLVVPLGEQNLASTSVAKGRLKYLVFRVLRPVTWRYDRLLADQTELSIRLAERVVDLEHEVERLRAKVEDGEMASREPS
ncbi:MAG TPA: hypothetical protein VLA82_02905 [Actinomycetota bacterium]|nr:hypothetical protein [Actinomycetota bacterium]